ncbi:MAG: HAMP domain-containing histidine kinase, partial [Betaproteobacteria bacterium]|nr:HAMP domain-containing histidine kinase [Betaproteobacteria bacterium]
QDNGAGISPDVLPHIFEMYYTTKAANEGTGLGLSIARDIVRQHGGDLTVRSQLGQGATFVVDLPVTLMEKAAA